MHQGFHKLQGLRWATSLALSVFLAGLLLATACSADCLGLRCLQATPSPTQNQHGTGSHDHRAMPAPGPSSPTGSRDCSAHGFHLVFDRASGKHWLEESGVATPAVAASPESGVALCGTNTVSPSRGPAWPVAPPRTAEVLRI